MTIECPNCNNNNYVDGEDLPNTASGSETFTCYFCRYEFEIGWFAEVEIR